MKIHYFQQTREIMVGFQPINKEKTGLMLKLSILTLSFIFKGMGSSPNTKDLEDFSFSPTVYSGLSAKLSSVPTSFPNSPVPSPVFSPRIQQFNYEDSLEQLQIRYNEQLNALLPSHLFEGAKRHIHAASLYETEDLLRMYGFDKSSSKAIIKLKESFEKQYKQLRHEQRQTIRQQLKHQRLTNASYTWITLQTALQELKEEQQITHRLQVSDKSLAKEIKKYQQLVEIIQPLLKTAGTELLADDSLHKKQIPISPRFKEETQCLVYSAQTGALAQEFLLPLQAEEKQVQLFKNTESDKPQRSFKSKHRTDYREIVRQQMAVLNHKLDAQDMLTFSALQTAWQKASTLTEKKIIRQQLIDYFETCRDLSREEINNLRFYVGAAPSDQGNPFKNYKVPPLGHASLTEAQAEQLLSLSQPIQVQRTYIDMNGQSYTVIEFYTQERILELDITEPDPVEDLEETLKLAFAKAHAPVLASNPDPIQDALNFLRAQGKYQSRIAIPMEIITDEEFKILVSKQVETIHRVGQKVECFGPKVHVISSS
jgi:ribosomal protein S13